MFLFLLEREEGREKGGVEKREREMGEGEEHPCERETLIHWWAASCKRSDQGSNPQLRYVP